VRSKPGYEFLFCVWIPEGQPKPNVPFESSFKLRRFPQRIPALSTNDQVGLDRMRGMLRGAGLNALTKRSECNLRYRCAGDPHRGERRRRNGALCTSYVSNSIDAVDTDRHGACDSITPPIFRKDLLCVWQPSAPLSWRPIWN
jgi:hypothetical protein